MATTETIRLDGAERLEVTGPERVTITAVNQGPDTCYYGTRGLTLISNEGSLAVGASLAFSPTKWFLSGGRSRLHVTTPTQLEQLLADVSGGGPGPPGVDGTQGPQGNPGATGAVGPAGGTALTLVDKSANFTLALADVGKHYQASSAGAIVVTIPTNAAAEIPVGSVFTVIRRGAGAVSFAGSVGVTVNSPYGYLNLARQFSSIAAVKVATDEWDLFGDLS